MEALTGVVLAGGGLLVAAGVPKLARPHETARALRAVGARVVQDGHVRLLAVVEVLVGLTVVVTGEPLAVAAAASLYVGFTTFLLVALRRGGVVSSCGCSGRADTPPTYAHLVMTSLFAAGCTVGAALGVDDVATVYRSAAGPAGALLLVSTITGWLGWVVLTVLPRATAARSTPDAT